MHDSVATFYGGYEQTGVGRLPRLRVPGVQLAIGVAAVALLMLVASDVAVIDNLPARVQVTSVIWLAGGQLVATTAGFTVVSSHSFTLEETCQLFCFNFDGASVSAPFQLVGVSITNQPVQYANLTIRAPAGAYMGPLSVTLDIGLG